MNVLSWNVRGANKVGFIKNFKYLTHHYSADLLLVLEPKISGNKAEEVCDELKKKFPNVDRIEAQGFKGGLWLLWDEVVCNVEIISKEENFIRVEVCKGLIKTQFIFLYTPPFVHRRRRFWEALHCEIGLCLGPLTLIGDFNCILSTSERVGGLGLTHLDSPKFQSLVDDYALVDLGFATTWCKWGDSESYVAKRLDRAFVKISACLQWPDVIVKHLSRLNSDHNPILLSLAGFIKNVKYLTHHYSADLPLVLEPKISGNRAEEVVIS
ncbi:LOW QUALITY PROTEIN: hypothetical protein V2J09_007962 [Rumex salicifolius]